MLVAVILPLAFGVCGASVDAEPTPTSTWPGPVASGAVEPTPTPRITTATGGPFQLTIEPLA